VSSARFLFIIWWMSRVIRILIIIIITVTVIITVIITTIVTTITAISRWKVFKIFFAIRCTAFGTIMSGDWSARYWLRIWEVEESQVALAGVVKQWWEKLWKVCTTSAVFVWGLGLVASLIRVPVWIEFWVVHVMMIAKDETGILSKVGVWIYC